MRKIKEQEATISACAELTLIHRIPVDKLREQEQFQAAILQSIRDAISASEARADRNEKVQLRLADAGAVYEKKCLELRRQKQRGHKISDIAREEHQNQYMTREMIKRGNALARSKLADVKKAYIIDMYRKGAGIRPIARLTADRFGNCSPSYVSKIVKGYKEKIQPSLSMAEIHRIK